MFPRPPTDPLHDYRPLPVDRVLIHLSVWVDMADPAAAVPSCDGVFTAKITRLSDGRGGGGVPPVRGEAMPPPPAGVRRDVGGGSGGGGGFL